MSPRGTQSRGGTVSGILSRVHKASVNLGHKHQALQVLDSGAHGEGWWLQVVHRQLLRHVTAALEAAEKLERLCCAERPKVQRLGK